MHPEEIKAALRMSGWTQASLADELNVTRASVNRVIAGTGNSDRVQRHISKIIGKPVKAIWPHQVTLRRSRQQLRDAQARRAAATLSTSQDAQAA